MISKGSSNCIKPDGCWKANYAPCDDNLIAGGATHRCPLRTNDTNKEDGGLSS